MELKNYSDWSLESDEAAPDERIRKYADYVRTSSFRSGGLNDEVEAGIRDGVYAIAQQEGLITEETPEIEHEGIVEGLRFGKPKSDPDADAKFLLDHYSPDPESEVKSAALRRYLTMRKIAPDKVESDGILDVVTPLLEDKAALRAARKAAVTRGDIPMIAVDEEDGSRQIYSGSGLSRERVTGQLDSLVSSGALAASDLSNVERHLSPVAEGAASGSQLIRFGDISRMVADDPELSAVLMKDAQAKAQREEFAAKSGGEKAWDVTTNVLGTAVYGVAEMLKAGARNLGAPIPETQPDTTPTGLARRLKQNPALSADYTPEELDQAASAMIAQQAGPSYRADRPGSGVGLDAYGMPLVARNLAANPQKFEEELALAPLSESQKTLARNQRTAMSAEYAPTNLKTILSMDSDAVSQLATARASGMSDQEFVEGWLSDPEKYSGFSERSQSFGMTSLAAVVNLAATPFALAGSETATGIMRSFNKDQNTRRQYAQMFGDEFGLGMDILNTVPQVATDIIAAIGTGGLATGVKTIVGGSVRAGLRTSARGALRTTAAGLTPEVSALLKSATVAGGESRLGAAFSAVGKELAPTLTTVERLAPMSAVTFTRSAGGMYVDLYTQLSEDPKTKHLTHEQKHEQAVGYAVAAGIGSALIVTGMSFLGRDGVEILATGRIRPGALVDDVFDDATGALKTTGTRNIPLSSLNYKQAKLLYEDMSNAGRALPDGAFKAALRKNIGGAWKNYFRKTLGGAWDEGLEETIDTALQTAITESARGESMPLAEKIEQYWKSFVIGGAMGGATPSVSQLVRPLNRNEVGMALDARMSVLRNTAASLRAANSPATAEKLERDLAHYQKVAGERATKELAEREKLEADKAAGIEPETPSEARFDNDMEEGVMLADLDGSGVHLGGEQGTVVIEGENAYFVPRRKPTKTGKQTDAAGLVVPEPLRETPNRILLGDANRYAAGVVTKLPTLPRDENGNYFVNIAGSKQRFRLPTVEEFQENPEAYFEFRTDSDGVVRQIHMKNLRGLDSDLVAEKIESNKYRIGRLAATYGLDLTPVVPEAAPEPAPTQSGKKTKPVTTKDGQLQMPFIEGKLENAPAPVFDDEGNEIASEPTPVGEGQADLDFRSQQERDYEEFVSGINKDIARYEARIAGLDGLGDRSEAIKLFKARIVELNRAKKNYSPDTIRLSPLSPEQQAELNPADAEWDAAFGKIRASAHMALSEVVDRGGKASSIVGLTPEENLRGIEQINDFFRTKDFSWNSAAVKRKLARFDQGALDTLDNMVREMDGLLSNPGTLPEASPEYRAAMVEDLELMEANIETARTILEEAAVNQMEEDIYEANDALRLQLLGDRDAPDWQAELDGHPDPEAAPEAEPEITEEEDDGSDVPEEDTPPPAPEILSTRVGEFLGLLGEWQDKIKAAADKADAAYGSGFDLNNPNPTNLNHQERQALINTLVKKATKEVINGVGASLYSEIQQTEALAGEARAELMERIAEADTGFKALVMKAKPTTRTGKAIKKAPQTFLTPKNTRWGGKSIKRVSPKFFRKGTNEQELFGQLVANGASPGWKAVKGELVQGADLMGLGKLVGDYNTTINGTVSGAFANSKVDHIKDGGTFTHPGEYLAAKNRQLGEEVRARFPETGTFHKTGTGWGFKLDGSKGKKGPKIETKTSKTSGVAGILVPYTESVVNGELTLTGVFTNNPAITRAQLAEGMPIDLGGFKGTPNPSILIEDGVVKGTYLPDDIGLQNPILSGQSVPLAEAYANRTGVERSSDANRAGDMLFEFGMVSPDKDPMVRRYYGEQQETIYKKFGNILYSNRSVTGARNPKYPYDSFSIDETLTETDRFFMQRLNEYRLAQRVTNSMMNGVRALAKGGAVSSPAIKSYLEGNGGTFADLETADQEALLKGVASKDVVSLAGHTNIVAAMRKFFDPQLSAQNIADGVNAVYNGQFAHGDPDAVLLDYARYLFKQTTSENGKFRTLPAAFDGPRGVVTAKFQQIANKYAAREKAQGKSVKTESFAEGGEEGYSGELGFMQEQHNAMFDTLGGDNRAMLDTLSAFASTPQDRYGDIKSIADSATAILDDALMADPTTRLIVELENTVENNKEVERAFHEIAKRASVSLKVPSLALLRGVPLVRELSRHLPNNFEVKEGRKFLLELNQTPSGRRAAALLIVNGWLPSYTVREKGMRGKTTNLSMMTPSEAKAAGLKAPAADASDSPNRAITEGEQARKAIFDKTKEDVEKREAGIYGVDEGGLYLNRQSRQQESEYWALYMAAVANLHEDLRDVMEERNAFSDMVELALREMQEAEADFALLGRGNLSDMWSSLNPESPSSRPRPQETSEKLSSVDLGDTREKLLGRETPRDAIENSEAIMSRFMNRKGTRISELNEEGDRLEAQAAATDKALQNANSGGYTATVMELWDMAESYPDTGKKARKLRGKPENFAAKYGVKTEQAEAIFAAETNTQRRGEILRAADGIGKKHTAALSLLPGLSRDLRAQAKIKFDQAAAMTSEVQELSKLPGERTVLQVLSKWEKAKNNLKNLEKDIKEFSPQARDMIRKEISRLETIISNPAYPALQELLYNHPSTIRFIQSRRPDYKPSERAMELMAKFDQKVYEARQAQLLKGIYPSATIKDTRHLTFRRSLSASAIGGHIDQNGNIIAPTLGQPEVGDSSIFRDWGSLKTSPIVNDEGAVPVEGRALPRRKGKVGVIRSWEGPFASMSTIDPALRDAANAANTEEMAALGLKEGDSESMIGALKLLRKSGPPHHKLAADILLAGAGDYVRTVNLVVVEMDNGFAGLYDRGTNSVILNLNEFNGRGLADVLLHELLHGATVNVLANPQTAAQRAAVARIGQLRQMANVLAKKQGVTSPAILHGLESDAEFLSYALTAPEFQNLLKGLALPEQRNVWQRIVDSVMQFFGIDPGKFAKQRNAVEELLDFAKMGMAHRRTFTTDLRWDQHEADRVNRKAEAFNFHANRMAAEEDGVFAARSPRFQYRVDEKPLDDGSTQFTIYFDNKVEDVRVIDADMVDGVREDLYQQYTAAATDGDIAALAEPVRNALPAPGTGALSVDPEAELQGMMPEGMAITFDDQMIGVMGTRRSDPGTVRVHPEHLANMVAGLRPDKARAVIRATLDEELAELAADSVMADDDYTALAVDLSDSQRSKLEHSYFGVMIPDHKARVAKIAEFRESGQWTDADLGREWFRQHVTRMALGETREQVLDYKDSNPTLFNKIVDAIANYISVLKDRLATSFTNGTAARISQASRELRRLRNDGVLPDPERAPAGEYGDTTAFLNALDGNILPGQEDRVRFALPVAASDPAGQSKVDHLWRKMESKMYDIKHRELKHKIDDRNFSFNKTEYILRGFGKVRPLQEQALAEGVTNDEIMMVLGTTAPLISKDERAAVNKQLKDEGLGWKKSQYDNAVLKQREDRERELFDVVIMKFAGNFRKGQQAMEASLRARGYGEMVDLFVELRGNLNDVKMEAGFGASNDVYLTRTYRYYKTEGWHHAAKFGGKYTDPETGKEVDFDRIRAEAASATFADEVRKDAKKQNLTLRPDEIDQRVMEKLDRHLEKLDREAELSKTPDGVAMLRKDLNLLRTKEDVNPKLRALLGEVTDPFEVGVRTMTNVTRLAANETFHKAFVDTTRQLGIGSSTPKEGYELLFPDRRTADYGELAGWYVPTDIAVALRHEFDFQTKAAETFSNSMVNGTVRWLAKASGTAILTKTSLGGPGFWTRNILGGGIMTAAQGLLPLTLNSVRAANTTRLANMNLGENSTEGQRKEIQRLIELGIVLDDTRGRMATDLLKGFASGSEAQMDETTRAVLDAETSGDANKAMAAVGKVGGFVVGGAANLNNWVDSFIKLNAYYQELAITKKNWPDKSQSEAEAFTAYKIKLTFPTHSQQMDVVKSFNKSPLALQVMPFLRWKSEVIRTSFNTIPLALEEMRSSNAGEKVRGVRRFVSFLTTVPFSGSVIAGGSMMIFGAIANALGDEDDEEGKDELSRALTPEEVADYRRSLAVWQRDNHLALRIQGGKIQSVNLTNVIPYSLFMDYVSLAQEGIVSGRGIDIPALARYTKSQVIGANILASSVNEVVQNEDDFGHPIALSTDPAYMAPVKMLNHLVKGAFVPGMYRKLSDIAEAGGEDAINMAAGEVAGVRTFYTDRDKSLVRGLRSLRNELSEVVALRRPLEDYNKLDHGDIPGVVETHQAALNRNALNTRNFLRTMRALGATENDIRVAAKKVGLSKQRIQQISAGISPTWYPAPEWVNKTGADILREGKDDMSRFPEIIKAVGDKANGYPIPHD